MWCDSPRIEFVACSKDSVPWCALRRAIKGTGSVLVLHPKRGRAERICGEDREVPWLRTAGIDRPETVSPHQTF